MYGLGMRWKEAERMLNRKQEENEKLRSKHEDGRCLIRRVLRLKTSSFVSKIIVSHFRGAGSVEQDRSPLGTWVPEWRGNGRQECEFD